MSTRYFILTKNENEKINENSRNQIVQLNTDKTYILPSHLIDYYCIHGLFENNLIQWCIEIFSNKDKVFLDVGAHTGTYTISMASKFKEVYSFECQKMTYYALCGSIALSNLNNVNAIGFGLGSKEQEGEKILKIVSNDGGGSTVKETDMPVLREEKISIRTLDSFNIQNVGFIKIDIEGNELDMLKGSTETLKNSNYPPILFESNHPDKDVELFNFIRNLGYNVTQLTGVYNMFLATR